LYNEDHFDNDEDPIGDDVSSEGSCIQTNSYKRSQIDRVNEVQGCGDLEMMDEYDVDAEEEDYDQDEDGNVDIPDEESESSPRKIAASLP
jgi:hypothetical protein